MSPTPPRSWRILAYTVLLAAVLGGCSQADNSEGSAPVSDESLTTPRASGSAPDAAPADTVQRATQGLVAGEARDAAPTVADAPATTAVKAATSPEPSGRRSQPQPSAEPSGSKDEPQPSAEPSGSKDEPQPSAEPSGSKDEPQRSAEALAPPVAAQEEALTDRPAPIAAVDEFIYPDEPEPAESVVATLCNLDQGHLTALRNEDSTGQPVVDDDLRMSVLALSDQLSYWDTLRSSYPQASADIDRASEVYDLWDSAVLSQENGETAAAQSAMVEADEVISTLSNEAVAGDICVG